MKQPPNSPGMRKPLKSHPVVHIKYPVKSLIKALQIMEELADRGGCGVTELSKILGLRLSTVHRLLSTLKGRGYVLFDSGTSKYSLGGMITKLGDSLSRQSPLLRHGMVTVEELSRECNETVNLAVLEGTNVRYTARHESNHSLRVGVGGDWPAYATALGKACLAGLSDDEVLRLYKGSKKFRKLTPHTISTMKDLLAELVIVRREGIAMDNQENSIGVQCLAVPVTGSSGKTAAALSISAPSVRMTPEHIRFLKLCLVKAGADLSAKLGFTEVKPLPPS